MRCNEKGRSMIEMLGVLAIVGVLSVGGIAGYSKAMGKYKTNQLLAQMSEIIVGVRTIYNPQKSYAGINIEALLNTGVIPASMRGGAEGNTAHHALGGMVTIYESTTATQADGSFEIYFGGLTESACKELAAIDWSQDTSSGFMSMYVGAGDITDKQMEDVLTLADGQPDQGIYTAGSHNNGIPLSVAEVADACRCPDNACVIGLKYK